MNICHISCLFFLLAAVDLVRGKTFLEDLTISDKEKQILDEFRQRVSYYLPHEYMKQDAYLLRWLRTGFFNIDKSEHLLNENLKWRAQNDMDNIHNEDWSQFRKDFPCSFKGRARDGKPQFYAHIAKWDLRQAALSGKSERFYRYVDKLMDEAVMLVRQLGERDQNVSQVILLLNIEGFNLVQHGCLQCIPLILKIISTYETHFPDYADKLLVVNAPAAALPVVRIARGVMHPITNKALIVYGPNKRTWMQEIDKEFSVDNLPKDLGGLLVTEDDTEDYEYFDAFSQQKLLH